MATATTSNAPSWMWIRPLFVWTKFGESLPVALSASSTEKIHLIHSAEDASKAVAFKKDLQKFKFPIQLIEIRRTVL